ncbi:MAG: hypothetical protein ACPGVX_01765 [Thalassobaculaceae bacterium]
MFDHHHTPTELSEARFREAARTAHHLRAVVFVTLLRRMAEGASGLVGGFGRTVAAAKALV